MKGMHPKLCARKPRHSRGRFTFLQFRRDHYIATFSSTLVSNNSTKKFVLITQISDIQLLFSPLRYPNITTAIKVKGWQCFCCKQL